MSRHEGVSCDSCLKSNFSGLRYKCLICYDYDLCAACYSGGATSSSHSTDHAVQLILTRADLNLYYGGDSSVANQPQSYSCSYCGRMGFTVVLLQEHIRANHGDALSLEVVCPVCAAHPGGDPNNVTDDLATHIALVHRSGTEFDDDQLSGIRQIRRLTHPVRTSNFGSRPTRGPGPVMQLIEPSSVGMSPTGSRDTMDPIAELLSQLTSVRSRAAIAQGMTSHLQQIEMHLASVKLSQRQADSAKASATLQTRSSTLENQSATAKPTSTPSSGVSASNNRTQFLLLRYTEKSSSESEKQKQEAENADKSLFVQDLYLSSLAEQLGKERKCSLLSEPLKNISPSTELTFSTQGLASHLVNGENSLESLPATITKSYNSGCLTNNRPWDHLDADNCQSPGDSSNEDDVNSGDERLESSASVLSKESRLL